MHPDAISAVLLDAGGVLLLPDPGLLRDGLARFGVTPDDEACRYAHYEAMRVVDQELGAGSWNGDWTEVDRRLARRLGISAEDEDEAVEVLEGVYSNSRWVPIAGAAEALVAIEGAGYPLAIVSNATGTMEEQLATHEICSIGGGTHARVAIVVDSHVVGVEKPDPAIFGFALDALGVPAGECLFVGDSVMFDVAGARAAGLHPLHMDPYDMCEGRDHGHLHSLGELAERLTEGMREHA